MDTIKAGRKLIILYRSITLEQIKHSMRFNPDEVVRILTGYSSPNRCILCQAVNKDCKSCFYSFNSKTTSYPCLSDKNKKSYNDLNSQPTARSYWYAIQRRAKHIEKLLNKLETI